MNTYDALNIIDGGGDGWLMEDVAAAVQHIIDTREAWTLPGRYGRLAANMIDNGICQLPPTAIPGRGIQP